VADQPQLERHAALFTEAERRRVRRVRHAEHAVGVRRLFARELTAEGPPRAVHARAPDARVGAREVHQLEYAGRGPERLLQTRQLGHRAVLDLDDLTRLERAVDLCADQVERARLARQHPAAARAAEHEWPVDRKSTRLNSSHVKISYAVFCL